MRFLQRHPRVNLFVKKTVHSDVRKSTTKKILASIFAIFCALVIAIIVACTVCGTWNKVGQVITTIFTAGFQPSFVNSLISNMSIMIVAGLAFIFAYKAGLFNIGISGQMVMGGTVATIICHKCGLGAGANQVVILIASVLSGALVAGIVGALKAYLNVNEVVSSIMFNWIIYYMSILILASLAIKTDSSGLATLAPPNEILFRMGADSMVPLIIMAILLVGIVAVVINFTVFGRKLKVTGLSRTGALAAGYNVKANMILSMAISGAIAGVLGVMVYAGFNPQMPITAAAKAIPQEGFNGISVGLIAMCSPIATIPVGLFFSMVQTSVSDLQTVGIDNHIAQVVFGIVVYGSAAIALFLNLKPYWLTLKIFKGKRFSKIKHEQNMADIALIEYASDYNAQLKKYYVYSKKQINIKCALALTPGQKLKCKWYNLRYHMVKFFVRIGVKFKQTKCAYDGNKYFYGEMIHLCVKHKQVVVCKSKCTCGGIWFKPTSKNLAPAELEQFIQKELKVKPSAAVIKEIKEIGKQMEETPFDTAGAYKIPLLSWLQNQRTGLAYRYDIAHQNVLDKNSLESVEKQEGSLGLPPIKSRRDYEIAFNAHAIAYTKTANEIKKFYDAAYAKYSPNKKAAKAIAFDPLDVKYDLSQMEKSYLSHLRAEIRKIRDSIEKPFLLEAEVSAKKGA